MRNRREMVARGALSAVVLIAGAACAREVPDLVPRVELERLEERFQSEVAERREARCQREAFRPPVEGTSPTLSELVAKRFAPCVSAVSAIGLERGESGDLSPPKAGLPSACEGVAEALLGLASRTAGCAPRFVGHPRVMDVDLHAVRLAQAVRWSAAVTAAVGGDFEVSVAGERARVRIPTLFAGPCEAPPAIDVPCPEPG